MQVFKMLFENNVKRVLMLASYLQINSFCPVDDRTVKVFYDVFSSGKNCVISTKKYRQSGETTNLLAYAGIYCQTHFDKIVFYVVDTESQKEMFDRCMYAVQNIAFVTKQQFDIAVRGCNDIGLVIVDSQVTDTSNIIKHSYVMKDTQFVISTDESNIKYI